MLSMTTWMRHAGIKAGGVSAALTSCSLPLDTRHINHYVYNVSTDLVNTNRWTAISGHIESRRYIEEKSFTDLGTLHKSIEKVLKSGKLRDQLLDHSNREYLEDRRIVNGSQVERDLKFVKAIFF